LQSGIGEALLAAAFACVAFLYSIAGQAGGTGYIAVMGLAGFSAVTIKPVALILNILVAAIGCVNFYRAGLLTWRSCYPFAILGIPFSILGGTINLPEAVYQPVVGLLLLLAALQMARSARTAEQDDRRAPVHPPFLAGLLAGGALGFISGVTGVGGGIFLAPLVLTMVWAASRQTAAIAATFNLFNSASALTGVWATMVSLPPSLPLWLAAVGLGGIAGSWLSIRFIKPAVLRILLGVLLATAGIRMIAKFF